MKKLLMLFCPVLLAIFAAGGCKNEVKVSELIVEPADLVMAEGEEVQLTVIADPQEAIDEINVKNSDESVAVIDGSFKVTALKEGESTITFSAGGKSAVCSVRVSAPELGLSPALESLVFDAAFPETYEFEITGPVREWNVECDADWCVVTKTEKGFNVTAKPTISKEDKEESVLTVRPESSLVPPVNITIKQNGLKIYLAGDDNHYAKYWLNGESYWISDAPTTYVTDIYATKEGNVSIVGRSGSMQCRGFYWDKNKGIFSLNSKEESSGTAFSVFVDESTGDIYFTDHEGWMVDATQHTIVARLWKNFEPVELVSGTNADAQAGDVILDNGNIYVMVQSGNECYYLKNEEKIVLENMDSDIYPSSMCIVGEDVYIGGYYLGAKNFNPCYWKNGKITVFETDKSSQVYGIYVNGEEDVYLAGSYGSGYDRAAAYWENGEMTVLTDHNNSCLSGIAEIDGNIVCGGTLSAPDGVSYVTCWINGEEWRMSDGSSSCWVEAMFIR